nr:ABC transporter permease [uncultured Blautia sp.]
MNILCTLACSQIKRKKSRTAITIAAISLSTALLTAVINFAVSGNTMVQGFLGEDYGEFGSAYTLLLLIPAAILGALIIAMAVIVISNAFRMSANERVAQFGTLKCVGATKEQVYKTIMYECVILCIVAIPLGVVLGYLLSFVGIGISNQFMEEMNTLVRIMIKQVNFSLSFVFSPAALLVSVLISGITVFVAAMIPAKKAMKVSALDCLRNGGEIRGNLNVHAKAQINGKRSIEYQLARKNVASNRKQMKSAVMALSVSMILFVSMSGLKEIADGVQEYMTFDYGYSVVADYTANRKYTTNPETGRREEHAQMISSELAEEILSELSEYQGTEVYGSGVDYATYDTPLSSEELTPEVQKALEKEITEENGELLLDVERIILDEKHYRELCQQAGVEYGGILLLNDYKYNDHGTEKHVQPLPSSTTSLKLEKADGSSQEIEIAAVLSLEEIPERLLYPNTNPVRIVVPKGEVRGYTWMTTPENENGYMEYARQVLESYFPQNGMDYGEAGYVSRVYGAEDYSKFMNIAIVLAAFFIYAFVFLLGMIGILNVISAVSFQIRTRARELAVLKSVGITSESLEKMLNIESVLCSGKALVTGLPVGILLVLIMGYCVKMVFPISFHMPWGAILIAIAVSFGVIWGTVKVSLNTLKKQNIIETIRTL